MKKLLLLHGEFVYADLGVGVSRIQDDGREGRLVHGIRVVLGFKSYGCPEIQRLAILPGGLPVEEVAGVYLDCGLVGKDGHATP